VAHVLDGGVGDFPGRNDEKWEDGDRFQWKLGSSLIMVNYNYSNID
jgi:hypothetical protein